jgi:preprotein translocase subunit SecD
MGRFGITIAAMELHSLEGARVSKSRWIVALGGLALVSIVLCAGVAAWIGSARRLPAPVTVLTFELEGPESESSAQAVAQTLANRFPTPLWGPPLATAQVVDDRHVALDVYSADPAQLDAVRRRAQALGTLEFRILAHAGYDDDVIALAQGLENEIVQGERTVARWITIGGTPENADGLRADPNCVVRPHPESSQPPESAPWQVLTMLDPYNVNGSLLAAAIVTDEPQTGRPALELRFSSVGAEKLAGLTGDNVPSAGITRRLAIILDQQVTSAPTLLATISERALITGDFPARELEDLAAILRGGSLPARIRLVREEPAAAAP